MTATTTRTEINLLDGCAMSRCLSMAGPLDMQLRAYSRGAAIMPLNGTYEQWLAGHRTARRRAARARRLGYRFAMINRQGYEHDVYMVNTSKGERQGRPMSDGYSEPPSFGANPLICRQHHVYPYAVLADKDELVAYLWLYRCGQLAMVSSILGHADHLENDVMYLLYAGMLEPQFDHGGTVFYNLWNSGTDGLRYFKERVGLAPGDVQWTM